MAASRRWSEGCDCNFGTTEYYPSFEAAYEMCLPPTFSTKGQDQHPYAKAAIGCSSDSGGYCCNSCTSGVKSQVSSCRVVRAKTTLMARLLLPLTQPQLAYE